MNQPLMNRVIDDGNLGGAEPTTVSTSTMTAPGLAVKSATVWKPVIVRVVLGGVALLGLAGVGAASMLAGLDGARANPPASSAVHMSTSSPTAASAAGAALTAAASPLALAPDACAARTADGKVILNLATMADLRTLPNIGQKRAQAILNLREKLKKFHRIQELRRVKGIGAKTLQKLAPKILVDAPPGSCPTAGGDLAKKS